MPASQRSLFDELASEHLRAWQELASSTAAVASLPGRTIAAIFAGGVAPLETPAERLERTEAALNQLAGELREARARLEALGHELGQSQHALAGMRRSYEQLAREAEQQASQAREDLKLSFYRTMEPLLTQLPVVRRSIEQGRAMEAADLLALLGPLNEVLADWGLEPVEAVGAEVPFDPARHQMAAGAAPEPGTPVLVKHVGFRLGEQLLRRAKVTRRK